MKKSIILFLLTLSLTSIGIAQVQVSLTVDGSTVRVFYHPEMDYPAPPTSFWLSQVITIRWPAASGGVDPVTIPSVSNPSTFSFAKQGNAVADNGGSPSFFYQIIASSASPVVLAMSNGIPVEVFNFNYSSSDGIPAFELVTGSDLPPSVVGGDAAVNNAGLAPNNQFNGFVSNNTFPVEWLYFDAKPLNSSDVELTWGTAREVNNSHFMVESSIDGTIFEAIDRVDGNGTVDNEQAYDYIDEDVNMPVIYYRLKQIDLNGAFEYSDMVEVDFAKFPSIQGVTFEIFPSPTVDFVNVEAEGKLDKDYELRITDILGRSVYEGKLNTTTGNAKINVSKFSEGIYYISLSDVRTNEVYGIGKFVKE